MQRRFPEPYGGSLDAYAQMCEEARQQAFSTLVAEARTRRPTRSSVFISIVNRFHWIRDTLPAEWFAWGRLS